MIEYWERQDRSRPGVRSIYTPSVTFQFMTTGISICAPSVLEGVLGQRRASDYLQSVSDLTGANGAGGGNRTRIISLEG